MVSVGRPPAFDGPIPIRAIAIHRWLLDVVIEPS